MLTSEGRWQLAHIGAANQDHSAPAGISHAHGTGATHCPKAAVFTVQHPGQVWTPTSFLVPHHQPYNLLTVFFWKRKLHSRVISFLCHYHLIAYQTLYLFIPVWPLTGYMAFRNFFDLPCALAISCFLSYKMRIIVIPH